MTSREQEHENKNYLVKIEIRIIQCFELIIKDRKDLTKTSEAINKLQAQADAVDKRIKVLEARVADSKKLALEKKKAKDDRGARNALRNAKMLEKELMKLDG